MSAGLPKDLHAILGVDEKAGPEELRRAYLALAVKYHPDRNPGDLAAEEKFKDISQAYAILSDPTARARYERLRPKKTAKTAAGTSSAGGAKTSSSAGASAGARNEASSGPGASADASGTSSGPGRPAGGGTASGQGAGGPESAAGADRAEGPEPDFEEILAEFFKTAKGRDTLRDLEGALGQAGIKFKMEDFTRWFKGRRETPAAGSAKPAKPFWERLAAKLPGAEARARKKAELHDINYQLALTPQAAAAGTMVEISYQRDDGPHHLKIRIPAGAKDGSRLRLNGQGLLKPDQGGRGDLVLTILVSQPVDIWKQT